MSLLFGKEEKNGILKKSCSILLGILFDRWTRTWFLQNYGM